MWFIFTLVTILFWSGSDLFSKMGSAPDDKNSHWKMVLAVGAGLKNMELVQIHPLGDPQNGGVATFVGNWLGVEAVSYTHLDVYKRQLQQARR